MFIKLIARILEVKLIEDAILDFDFLSGAAIRTLC